MNIISYSSTYGPVYDGPGGSGGGYMKFIPAMGWVKNPDYEKPLFEENPMKKESKTTELELLPAETTTATAALPVAQPQAQAGTPLALLQYAMTNGGANLDQLERFMMMHRDHEAHEARKAYVDAMAQFKKNPPEVVKDKLVGYRNKDGSVTGYTHATLGAVTTAIVAGLAEHGFSHRWDTQQDGNQITVTCIITHKQGHSESTSLTSGKDDSGKKNAIQQVASAITYLQRYTLLAATGVATKDQPDDDGNGFTADTRVADEWIAKLAECKADAEVVALWEPALKVFAKDKLGLKEFEEAFIARRAELQGGTQ